MTQQYSTVQKISLAGMVIGALLCIVGIFSPYWIVSDIQGTSGMLGVVVKVMTKVAGVKGYMGLFVVCLEAVGKSGCEVLDMDHDSGWFHSVRVAGCGCILLSGLCAIISLSLACCTCCKRFIVVGILAFIAACTGAFTVIGFYKNVDAFTSSVAGFKLMSYGWGFWLCCAGSAVMGIVSFLACFSAPDNPMRGMIIGQGPSVQVVSTSASASMAHHPYMTLQEQHPAFNPADTGPSVVTTNGY